VVLRDYYGGTSGVKILGRHETDIHQVHPFRNPEFIGPDDDFDVRHHRGTTYRGVQCLADFVLDDERSYAVWFGPTDKWLTLSLENYQFGVVKDEQKVAKLNARAYLWAEQLVLEHQPHPLRRAVDAVRKQVAKVVPSFAPQSRQQWFSGETVTAYLFLCDRHIPSDKRYIEGLANFQLTGVHQAEVSFNETI
jgi:hypothetical protein